MFQSVRPNSQIYIYHKGAEQKIETGVVTNNPMFKPKYTVPPTFGTPQEMVVDLVVKVGSNTYNFNSVPASADVSDTTSNGEHVTISMSREAINAEILSEKQKSVDAINSIDYHKQRITSCDKLLSDFNPEYAEKQVQKEEIETLKSQMLEVTKGLSELMAANKLLIDKLSKEEKQ